MSTDSLSLKWGTVKAWDLKSEPALAAAKAYFDAGKVSGSAMLQHDTPEQVEAICSLIDALNSETVFLEWDGAHVSKDAAKAYVREYPREKVHGA